MRNMLAFVAAVALTVVIAGWYLGWYSIRSTTGNTGHRNVNIDINTKKIGQDLQQGANKVEKILDKNTGPVLEKPTELQIQSSGLNPTIETPPLPKASLPPPLPIPSKAHNQVATDPHSFEP